MSSITTDLKVDDIVKLTDNKVLLDKWGLQWEKEGSPNREYKITWIITPLQSFGNPLVCKLDDSNDLDYPPEVLVKVN